MATKYVRKVSTGSDVIGGLITSRYEKLGVAYGVIAGDQYTNDDTISFGDIPSSMIIDGKLTIHQDPVITTDIYPGMDLSAALIMDSAATADLSYVIRYIKSAGIVGAEGIPLSIEFDSSTLVAPAFSVAAGTFTSTQTVTITTAKKDDVIRYTVDGSAPSATAGTIYTVPVVITDTTTLKAIAYKGTNTSTVTSATYTITPVATPTFDPVAGTYAGEQTVTIATATAGATIRYTDDGVTAPSATVGTVYTVPVTVAASATLKAIAYKTNQPTSAVATAAYVIE